MAESRCGGMPITSSPFCKKTNSPGTCRGCAYLNPPIGFNRLCNYALVPWREKDFRFPQAGLQVRIDFLPVFHCRDDAEFDDFVTHLAEVLVRSFEGCHFFGSSFRNLE